MEWNRSLGLLEDGKTKQHRFPADHLWTWEAAIITTWLGQQVARFVSRDRHSAQGSTGSGGSPEGKPGPPPQDHSTHYTLSQPLQLPFPKPFLPLPFGQGIGKMHVTILHASPNPCQCSCQEFEDKTPKSLHRQVWKE